MDEGPPNNRLLELLRNKPSSATKSSTQPATKSSTQPATSDTQSTTSGSTQSATKSSTQPAKKDTQPVTKSSTQPATKSGVQPVTESSIPNGFIGLSKGQERVLRYLMKNRDPEHPSQTVIIGYDTISTFCILSRSGSRKVIGQLQQKGLITRRDVHRGHRQGSVYILPSNTQYAPERSIPDEAKSDIQYVTKSDTCSSSQDLKKLLLQNAGPLILEKAFEGLNPSSLSPYLDQFGTLDELQNFLDMANACIESSKSNGQKPIQNPHGFLFAQLRAGYINPPPGFKSRRVLAQEAMNVQLQAELEELKRLREQEAALRFELFKERLTHEQREALEAEAAKRVHPKAAVSRERQMVVYRDEVLQEWFESQRR